MLSPLVFLGRRWQSLRGVKARERVWRNLEKGAGKSQKVAGNHGGAFLPPFLPPPLWACPAPRSWKASPGCDIQGHQKYSVSSHHHTNYRSRPPACVGFPPKTVRRRASARTINTPRCVLSFPRGMPSIFFWTLPWPTRLRRPPGRSTARRPPPPLLPAYGRLPEVHPVSALRRSANSLPGLTSRISHVSLT